MSTLENRPPQLSFPPLRMRSSRLSTICSAGCASSSRAPRPEFEEIRERYPSKVLQLGVVPPLPEPDPDTHETPEQFAKRLRRPPSNLGLDFEMQRGPGGEMAVEVEGRFSTYVQRYPDRQAQEQFYSGGQERQTREQEENPEDADTKENMRLLPVFKRFDIETGRIRVELEGDTGETVIELDEGSLPRLVTRSLTPGLSTHSGGDAPRPCL